MIHRVLASCLALVAAVGLVRAGPDLPKPKRLVLTPAASPAPALKYTLLPELRDQKPGDAAPLYRKAAETLTARKTFLNDPGQQRADRWMEMPLERLRAEVKQALAYLEPLQPAFDEIEDAARRETCDWGLLEECRKDTFSLGPLLNDLQRMREFTFFFRLRAKVALADDRIEDALRDTRMVFTFSQHCNQGSTLIHSLVAAAISTIGASLVEAILQHPRAPNLYWALADLPRPFVDLRKALQGERLVFYATFPGLAEVAADPKAGALPPEKIAKYGKILVEMGLTRTEILREVLPSIAFEIPVVQEAVAQSAVSLGTMYYGLQMQRRHEAAKRALMERGRPREKVEQMPPLQVALLHAAMDYEHGLDELRILQNLPYWQAQPGWKAFVKKRWSSRHLPESSALPLTVFSLPVVWRTLFASARVERQFAAFRCVEAIRLHAAAHGGQLPATLEEIKAVSVPLDPVTGKPFEYTVEGDRAILSAVATPMDYAPSVPRYELKLRR